MRRQAIIQDESHDLYHNATTSFGVSRNRPNHGDTHPHPPRDRGSLTRLLVIGRTHRPSYRDARTACPANGRVYNKLTNMMPSGLCKTRTLSRLCERTKCVLRCFSKTALGKGKYTSANPTASRNRSSSGNTRSGLLRNHSSRTGLRAGRMKRTRRPPSDNIRTSRSDKKVYDRFTVMMPSELCIIRTLGQSCPWTFKSAMSDTSGIIAIDRVTIKAPSVYEAGRHPRQAHAIRWTQYLHNHLNDPCICGRCTHNENDGNGIAASGLRVTAREKGMQPIDRLSMHNPMTDDMYVPKVSHAVPSNTRALTQV